MLTELYFAQCSYLHSLKPNTMEDLADKTRNLEKKQWELGSNTTTQDFHSTSFLCE